MSDGISGKHSIRTKVTLLVVAAVAVAMGIATFLGALAIRDIGTENSEETLMLLCESGQKNLNSYFESVEQSVEMVSAFVRSDLEGTEIEQFGEHLDRVRDIFQKMAGQTHGVLTYYYRVDPSVTKDSGEKGFWYVNQGDEGFKEHEVTEISLYDTDDTSQLVWFTVPKHSGKPVWLPPYITDNLDVRVLSYNVPIYKGDRFIGVVGIEIDYSTMAREVDNITLYDNGYAFINDAAGSIIYHPRMDVTTMEEQPKVPAGLLSDDAFVRYVHDGVEKQAVWLPLSNGMRLNVSVPVAEINAGWQRWLVQILAVSIVLLVVFIGVSMRLTGHITRPLREMVKVAERVDKGDYDCRLDYDGDDEVGILAKTLNRLIAHMKVYISDLNDLAYADALTSVHNKGAFDIYAQNLQTKLFDQGGKGEFAVCVFDCNNLKMINDQHGHGRGNEYLKNACALICRVFDHSPVFRIGGDEFAAVLQGEDYNNRDELLELFDATCAESFESSVKAWERIDVARGLAVYEPQSDETVNDVIRRADKLMYDNKWYMKHARGEM